MTGCNDDNSLIEACRAGRTEAFGVLVQRYQDRLYPTMLRLTGSADDALDLLQDAFLRAFEKLDRFQGESSFYTWVYRIAVNLALSGRRRRRVTVRLGIGGGPGRAARPAGRPEPERPDPAPGAGRARRPDPVGPELPGRRPPGRRGDEGVRRPPLRGDRGDPGRPGRDGPEPAPPGPARPPRAAQGASSPRARPPGRPPATAPLTDRRDPWNEERQEARTRRP